MFKKILILIGLMVSVSVFAAVAYASSLSVRLEQPKSPTNQNNLKLTFVTLDTQNRDETVNCFKKLPLDASFAQFGTQSLSAGGNSGTCPTFSMNSEGTYQFYVVAQADADSATSQTVSLEYKTSNPSTPENYSKEKQGCEYKIKFKTADDAGKTNKVEVYRSDATSFGVDDSTKIGTVYIGSNQEGAFSDTPSDCGKNYYYAIRAFDSAGNGSGAVGDSEVHVTNSTVSSSPSASAGTNANSGGGAIAASKSDLTKEGQVLGSKVAAPEATISTEPSSPPSPQENNQSFKSHLFFNWVLGIILAFAALITTYFYFRAKR